MPNQLDSNVNHLLPKFSGEGDARLWLSRFDQLAQLYNWYELKEDGQYKHDNRAQYFPLFLAFGSAAETWFSTLDQDTKNSFDEIAAAFEKRFFLAEGARVGQVHNFYNRKFLPAEKIEDYIDEMRRRADQLGKSKQDTQDAIVMGLPPNVKQFIISKEPKNMDELSKYARMALAIDNPSQTTSDLPVLVATTIRQELQKVLKPESGNEVAATFPVGPRENQRPNRRFDRGQSRTTSQQYQPPPFQRRQQGRPVTNSQQYTPQQRYNTDRSAVFQQAKCPRCLGTLSNRHTFQTCVFRTAQCNYCQKVGHLARACRAARASTRF